MGYVIDLLSSVSKSTRATFKFEKLSLLETGQKYLVVHHFGQ